MMTQAERRNAKSFKTMMTMPELKICAPPKLRGARTSTRMASPLSA